MAPLTPQQLKQQIRNVQLSGEFGLANPEDPKSYGRYNLGIMKEETKEKNGKQIKSSRPTGTKIQIELKVAIFQCGINEMSQKKDDNKKDDSKNTREKWQIGYKVIGTDEEIHDVIDCRETTRKIGYVKSSILKKVTKIEALSEKGEDHKCFFLEVKPGEKIKVYEDEDCKGDSTEIICPELPEGCDVNLHLDAPVLFAYEDDMSPSEEGKDAPETFRVEYGWNDGIFELLNQRNAQILYEEAVIRRNQLILDAIPIEKISKGKTKIVHWRTIASKCYSYEKRARNAVVSFSRDKQTGEIVQKDGPLSHAFFTELLFIPAGISKKGGKPYPEKNTTFLAPSKHEDKEDISFTKEEVNNMLEDKQTEGILVININCQYKPGNNMETIRVKPQAEAVVFTKLEKKKMNDPARDILRNIKSQVSADDIDEFESFKKTGVSRNDDEEKQGFIHKSKGKTSKSKAPKVEDEEEDEIPVTSSKVKKSETPKKNKKKEESEEEEEVKVKSKSKKEESEEEDEKPKKPSKKVEKKKESDNEEEEEEKHKKPSKKKEEEEDEEEKEKPKKPSKKKEESEDEEEKPKKSSKKVEKKKEESDNENEEEEKKPKKSSKKKEENEEEEEDKPKSKSKKKEESEEEEEKPKSKKKEESDNEEDDE